MKYLFCLTLFIVLSSCSRMKNIKISQIEDIWFAYSPNQDLNHGAEFEGEIMLQTYDGKQYEMRKNPKLSFSSYDLSKKGTSGNYVIIKKSNSFNDDKCFMTLKYSNKGEDFIKVDSIVMNFQGPLGIVYRGTDGSSGENQKNRGTPLLFRDGKDGESGTHGTNGRSVGDFTGHVWKDNTYTYFHIQENNSSDVFKYKMTNGSHVQFDLSGGRGGSGGNGGNGGNGKDGEIKGDKTKRPGDAGNGGDGGDAGNGGNGGSLKLFLHSNCSGIQNQISFVAKGGYYGLAGAAGNSGEPGTPLSGQQAAKQGWNGSPGQVGQNGYDGGLTISFEDFNILDYE